VVDGERDEELEGSNDCDEGVSEGMDEDVEEVGKLVEEVQSEVTEDEVDGGTEVGGGLVERESPVTVLGG
jgi:hypothetical protein